MRSWPVAKVQAIGYIIVDVLMALFIVAIITGCASTNLGDRVYADAECLRAISEQGLTVYMSQANPGDKDEPTAVDIANTVLMNQTPEKVLAACKNTLNAIGEDIRTLKAKKRGGPA